MYFSFEDQNINFDIPDRYKKIAINLSGGADSAILMYLVVKYLIKKERSNTEVNALTCANDLKHRWNARKSADVINYILDKTQFDQFNMHYTYYRKEQNQTHVLGIPQQLFEDKKIDLVVTGLTSNPKNLALVEDINGKIVNLNETGLSERIALSKLKPCFWTVNNTTYYTPFVNVDKRFISFLYKEFEADELLQLTRSCEDIPDTAYYNRDFENNPCGKCWWCLERKWAFGEF